MKHRYLLQTTARPTADYETGKAEAFQLMEDLGFDPVYTTFRFNTNLLESEGWTVVNMWEVHADPLEMANPVTQVKLAMCGVKVARDETMRDLTTATRKLNEAYEHLMSWEKDALSLYPVTIGKIVESQQVKIVVAQSALQSV